MTIMSPAVQGKLTNKEKSQIIKNYTDINFPGAFGGIERFRQSLKQRAHITIGRTALKELLSTLPIYAMHAQAKERFPRRKLQVIGAGIDFQADLAHMPEYNNFKYFLLLIDLYSNFIYVEPLKTKSKNEVATAFETLLTTNNLYKFTSLATDAGKEFISNKDFFNDNHIALRIKRGQNKAFQAENFIRILKNTL